MADNIPVRHRIGDEAIDAPATMIETAPAAPARIGPDRVRPVERGDLERVARLFLNVFRGGAEGGNAVEDAAAYMERLYLEGPYCEQGPNGFVQIDGHGDIGGFLGILKTRYRIGGDVLSAGILSTLMAARGANHGTAAPRLLRALNAAGFDLQLTDSANRASLAFARPMKYELLADESLRWELAFRPATILLDKARRKWPRRPLGLLTPFAGLSDALIGRLVRRPHRSKAALCEVRTLDAQAFAELLPRFLTGFRLHPLWPREELFWLLDQAAQKRANGPLSFVALCKPQGMPIGCYALHGEAGRVASVLHVFAERGHGETVIDHLIASAEEMGCTGVEGQACKALMPHLYRYPGLIFRYGGAAMVRSGREDVMAALRAGDILIGGLAGDRWTRLSADPFGVPRAR